MPRITSGRYAAVTSTLALAIALGGTSYAAITVGTKNIENNAVTSPKIAKNAVKSADVKNDSLTGADVNEGTFGKVPSAGSADSATTAGALAGGAKIVLVNHRTNDVVDGVLGSLNGLSVRVTCVGGSEVLSAVTTTNDSEISYTGVEGDNLGNPSGGRIDTFGPGTTLTTAGNPTDRQFTISFSGGDGRNVTAHLVTEDSIGANTCVVSGYLVG